MKLTPLDLLQQNFKKVIRGYDCKQVDAFLELVRTEWEAILREKQEMEDTLRHREEQIQEFREKERTLQETLMSAQRLADDMKQSARKESEIVVGQAELQADKIIHNAHSRLTQIIDEINELKRQRATFEGKLRGILESHLRLVELHKDARETSQIEDVSILPKRSSETTSVKS